MARMALLVSTDDVPQGAPAIPYTPSLRPYLADPLFTEHWIFNAASDDNLIGLKAGTSLTPRSDASGVRAITLGAGGTGYTTAPAVALAAPPAGGVQALAIAIISAGAVIGFFVTEPGRGYLAAPAVTLTGGGGTGATGTAVLDGRPTHNASSLNLRAGGVNGLISPFIDTTPMSMMFVAKYAWAGGIYGGAASDVTGEGGSFTYTSASHVFQNNMRGSAGTTGNVNVSGSSAVADGTVVFGMETYDGTTRQVYLGGVGIASAATTKSLSARKFAFGNAWYKVGTFDGSLELIEAAYSNERAASSAEIAAAYTRAKARQALLGRSVA